MYRKLPSMDAVVVSPSLMSTSRPHRKKEISLSKQPITASTMPDIVLSGHPWFMEESTSTQIPYSPVIACVIGSESNAPVFPSERETISMFPSSSVYATS